MCKIGGNIGCRISKTVRLPWTLPPEFVFRELVRPQNSLSGAPPWTPLGSLAQIPYYTDEKNVPPKIKKR